MDYLTVLNNKGVVFGGRVPLNALDYEIVPPGVIGKLNAVKGERTAYRR